MTGTHPNPARRSRSPRARRIVAQKALIVAALVTFTLSLPLPAIHVDVPSEPRGPLSAISGLSCLLLSKAHYASNILLMLVAPLACWAVRYCRLPWLPLGIAAVALASFAFVLATPLPPPPLKLPPTFGPVRFGVGFWVWALSHALMTAAVATPVWGVDPEDVALARDRRRLRDKWLPANRAA